MYWVKGDIVNPLARALLSWSDDLAALYLLAGALVTLRLQRSSVVARPGAQPSSEASGHEAGRSRRPSRRPVSPRRVRPIDPPTGPSGPPEVDA